MSTPAARKPPRQRPARAPAPPLPTMESLDRTHHRMLEVLAELERLVGRLDADGVDDEARSSAQAICTFFTKHARPHHAEEEQTIFPRLLREAGEDLAQQIERLKQDHGWLEEDWIELEPQLEALARGYSWYNLDELRHAVEVFDTLYKEHIALEESLIYPLARQLVGSSGR